MEGLLGLLRIHVHRGINLAVRDIRSSDPYVVVKMGKQKLKTRVVKRDINPEWNEDLTLSVTDPSVPIRIVSSIDCLWFDEDSDLAVRNFLRSVEVYDRDTFSRDDPMGDADFDIGMFMEAVKMRLEEGVPDGTVITRIQPGRKNCLTEESLIVWADGKVVQNMFLRLRNVECGEVELQLQWIDVPGSRGL